MNAQFTGRVLRSVCHDIRIIAPFLRAEPTGLWAYPIGGPGRALYWRMPHPLHPLECIASMRGMGGLESGDKDADFAPLGGCGMLRWTGWESLTERIAEKLFIMPATVRLLWHAMTPMNVKEEYSGVVRQLANYLYESAGVPGPPFERVALGPARPDFWTKETAGDIEL